jgi:hypothetical protein
MNIQKIYFLAIIVVFTGLFGCKKSVSSDNSGNVTGNGSDVPANAKDGVTFINSGKSVIFNLYAPSKNSVSVIGDFNNWQPTAMKKSTDGTRWWVQVDNIDPTKEYTYQYYIDNSIKVADPYAEKILDPDNDPNIPADTYPNPTPYPTGKTTGIVSVMQGSPTAYSWQVANFTRPDQNKLVIYELHVRDFIAAHNYKTLKDTLSYLVNLGVNAIELMPVNEFEGNDSWGYNPNFMMALDKYYGTKNDYKAFIDACHAKGIAVIQDIVLEDQFGSSPMVRMYANADGSPAANNPWFNTTFTYQTGAGVGNQLNHSSAATQYYTKNVMKYWMQEYHIDGFRFDQAKGFTQTKSNDDATWSAYDATRVANWKNYIGYMKSLDPSFYVILEYFAGNQEEGVAVNEGAMIWGNNATPAQQTTMGYPTGPSWDLSGLNYNNYGFSTSAGMVAYYESHDEERTMFKNEAYGNSNGTYSVKDIPTALKREEAAAAILFSVPGPKMFWEFAERGYDISINDLGGRLSDKPPHWEYMADANRHHLYATYAHLIKMKIKNDVFNTTSFSTNLAGAVKSVQLVGTDGTKVETMGNFDVTNQTVSVPFPSTGTWYDNITGTTLNVSAIPYSMTLAPGEYHVYSNTALKQ